MAAPATAEGPQELSRRAELPVHGGEVGVSTKSEGVPQTSSYTPTLEHMHSH